MIFQIGDAMQKKLELSGKVISGVRKAAFFTEISWVKEQCLEKLGFEPFPGTLNVELSRESYLSYESLAKVQGFRLVPPDPTACGAVTFPVTVDGMQAAIIIPDEGFRIHNQNTLEIVAPVSLKKKLNKDDGDTVTVTVERA